MKNAPVFLNHNFTFYNFLKIFIKGLGCNPKRQNFSKYIYVCEQIHCLPGQKNNNFGVASINF